jgi:hypothetical protein
MNTLRLRTKVMLILMLLFVSSWCMGFTYVDKDTGRVKQVALRCQPEPSEPEPPPDPPNPPPEDPHPPKE